MTANVTMLVPTSADIVITAPRTFRNLAEIDNPAENLVGVASAGSEGAITAAQLAVRPVNRAAEVLETVPGMVISQHSGEGKANQYYLRGFNLDHGFDFAQTVAGIPVNMPTHAHAQGYADSNFLIPELVSGVQFRKGPYYAENGDFSSAGSANINYFNVLDRPDRHASPAGRSATAGFSAPSPEGRQRQPAGRVRVGARQRPVGEPQQQGQVQRRGPLQPGQRPQRTVAHVPRLLEPLALHRSDSAARRGRGRDRPLRLHRGDRRRRDLPLRGVLDWQRSGANDSTRVTAYTQRYGVQLFHNFTYFLNDPENGDQFEQFERRWTSGAKLTHRRLKQSAADPPRRSLAWISGTMPSAVRWASTTRSPPSGSARSRADDANQTSTGFFGETEVEWSRKLRTTFGVRGDVYRWNVTSNNPLNSGKDTVCDREPEGVGGVRTVGRHRVLRELGPGLPLELRPRHRAAGRSGDGRAGHGLPALRAGHGRRVRRAHRGDSRACRRRPRSGTSASTRS